MTQLALDGIIYQMQANGGISRMFNEILPRMCALDPELLVRVYSSAPTRQPVPSGAQIDVMQLLRHDLRPSRIWKALYPPAHFLQWLFTLSAKMIWHSTYYTLPPRAVKGVVMTAYDTVYHQFPQMFTLANEENLRQQQVRSLKQADVVIAISHSTSNAIQQIHGLPASKIRVVLLAYSRDRFFVSDDIALRVPTSNPFLLYIGGRRHHKNFEGFIRAYSRWKNRATVDVIATGKPWSEQEQRLFADLDVADRVHVLDVNDRHLRDLYNLAAAFVYPSLGEGFGIPLLEAMACACPVVASRIPSNVEVGQQVPYFFDPADDESLYAALDSSLAGGRTAAHVRDGLKLVQTYSWDTTAAQTLDVYRALS
ncbi:MAG: glycosyltransferase family 4 protein [Anaerolineae bacterium]|nr:glycosyltransferase family 4 protein [Anaerolineae bacterium]